MSHCHLRTLVTLMSVLGPHRFNASSNPEYGQIGTVVVGAGPPGAAATQGGVVWWLVPVPPDGSLAPSLDCELVTTSRGIGLSLLWWENPMFPMGGPATHRAWWFEIIEYSPNESLSYYCSCWAGVMVGGDSLPPSAPLRPPPKLNMLEKRSMLEALDFIVCWPCAKRLPDQLHINRCQDAFYSIRALAEHQEASYLNCASVEHQEAPYSMTAEH